MSGSSPSPEEMNRTELEGRVRNLETRIEELQATLEDVRSSSGRGRATIQKRISDLEEVVDDLGSTVSHHSEQLETIADIGTKKTDKNQKIASIATFAMQKADDDDSKVILDAGEIRGCVGVKRRYSYTLIDNIGGLNDDGTGGDYEDGEYQWAKVRKQKTVTTGKGKRHKKKALKIDCNRLSERTHDPDRVRLHTTRSHGEGR